MIRQALLSVRKRDIDPFRRTIYNSIKNQNPFISRVESIYDRSPASFRTFLLFLYGVKSWFEAPKVTVLTYAGLAYYPNEMKQLHFLKSALSPLPLEIKIFGLRNFSLSKFAFNVSESIRLIRVLNLIARKNDFLIGCRMSATLFFYAWFERELQNSTLKAIFVSSEANPYAMAALFAAKKNGIKTVYIPHGYISDNPPRLQFDLSLLDGKAFKKIFEKSGRISGKIIYKGSDGDYLPLKLNGLNSDSLKVGIFLSIVYHPAEVLQIIKNLEVHLRPSKIIVRLHPNESWSRTELLKILPPSKTLEISQNRAIEKDIDACNLVVCGNTSAHLEIQKRGVPSLQLAGIDSLPHDPRHFISSGIVPFYSNAAEIDLEELKKFYGSEWLRKIQEWDEYFDKGFSERVALIKKDVYRELQI